MSNTTLEYIKVGITKQQKQSLQMIHTELDNKSFSLTVREVLSRGTENMESLFLVKDLLLSELNFVKSINKDQNKLIKEQANRIAQLEIKNLKENAFTNDLLKEFIEFGSLSRDDIQRIEKSSHRALFESLNPKKDKKAEME